MTSIKLQLYEYILHKFTSRITTCDDVNIELLRFCFHFVVLTGSN